MSELRERAAKDAGNRTARREAVERVLAERRAAKGADGAAPAAPSGSSFLAAAFVDQLRPLAMGVRPIHGRRPDAAGSGTDPDPGPPGPEGQAPPADPACTRSDIDAQTDSGAQPDSSTESAAGGAPEPGRHSVSLGDAFDPAVKADVLNSLLTAFVRRSHILLYAEDAWSEGYSVPLLASLAAEAGALHVPLDIPDWSLMTSHIDPILEDLTIVCHPYTPPPDLATGTRSDGSSSSSNSSNMAFFAGINRKRRDENDYDAPDERVGPWEEDNDEGPDAGAEDEAGRSVGRRADLVRPQQGPRKGPGGGTSERSDAAEDDAGGDPAPSHEMMANPLSREATGLLDCVLDDFVSTPRAAGGAERPRIIVLKHLGDLLNTRIGYTLFSRLVAAVVRHNSRPDALPVVVAGLMHPSLFHPETPPPSVPPFDVNPATPVALMPRGERSPASVRGLGDILDGILGANGQRVPATTSRGVGVQLIHMDSAALGGRTGRVYGAPSLPAAAAAAAPAPADRGMEELPLFARIGIPPPERSALLTPCNMQSPLREADDSQAAGEPLAGTLREAVVADQCIERNARVIRNICLLYRISGLELGRREAEYVRAMAGEAVLEARSTADGGLVFRRRPLYDEAGAGARPASARRGREGWYLDHRPLVAMLQSLPDDVARRYFFAESFLHRWISLAQALAVRESVSLEAIRKDPRLLTETGRSASIASRHLRAAWTQFLESFAALKRGLLAHSPEYASGDVGAESPDAPRQAEGTPGARILPLHRQVDFDEIGVGHRVEDTMDVVPDPPPPGSPDAQAQATQWADVGHQLEPPEAEHDGDVDGDGSGGGGGGGGGRSSHVPSPQRRIQAAKKNLTEYEQRLIASVVDPLSIPTGFSHVCAKDETVTTLQEIITLPMLRPEYFSKGVLRRYGVSGILLFGPPGTGKTMLAKAVAKESGSVVLNIRASDVYDKYVGEGEKLAEAVFTLARKLAPCVIFIDEVDALFSARSSGEPNKFRRDIMNQIMSEWDGINTARKAGAKASGSARGQQQQPPQVMVMAATNRPFDLDDAILRRLPRRILVDLPGEGDRAKILAIHLKDEDLDADVDLSALAKSTEDFSGSDLKNVCVAAAQAALREKVRAEVSGAAAAAATADGTAGADTLSVSLIDQLKRTRRAPAAGGGSSAIKLAARHFGAALKKVAPSSSDQMESLVELRKWDKIYGDGAQERKRKAHSIGFAEPKGK
ncbi:hypothetical protein H4R18_004043 [Coemansia javaensis]|uniref:AAA+ ATPase domain-containing protein n=1 Tax=Coemansia javaensis TaxID=2761396 RepID=A0A9W8LHG6_9FUNG|nr:hypothetical protein H4R18_004043 [Coemansia javaensis]